MKNKKGNTPGTTTIVFHFHCGNDSQGSKKTGRDQSATELQIVIVTMTLCITIMCDYDCGVQRPFIDHSQSRR